MLPRSCFGVSQSEYSDCREYHKRLSTSCPEDANELLKEILNLAQTELFAHVVQESVLNSAVDYITLGWTRMLQAAFDLMSQDELETTVPRYDLLGPH